MRPYEKPLGVRLPNGASGPWWSLPLVEMTGVGRAFVDLVLLGGGD